LYEVEVRERQKAQLTGNNLKFDMLKCSGTVVTLSSPIIADAEPLSEIPASSPKMLHLMFIGYARGVCPRRVSTIFVNYLASSFYIGDGSSSQDEEGE
ncbi:hypothetical protein KUCAC02_017563, partial [Chaenocephalus aceratus]